MTLFSAALVLVGTSAMRSTPLLFIIIIIFCQVG